MACAQGVEPVSGEASQGYITLLHRPALLRGSPLGSREQAQRFTQLCLRDVVAAPARAPASAAAAPAVVVPSPLVVRLKPLTLAQPTAMLPPPPRSAASPAAAAALVQAAGHSVADWALQSASSEEVALFQGWKATLSAYFEPKPGEEWLGDDAAIGVLQRLEAHAISLELLELSKIATVVNALRRFASAPVAAVAARIVAAWERSATAVMLACSGQAAQ